MPAALASTSIGHSLSVFFDAVGKFFSDLAAVHWGALVLALAFFGLNLTVRSRAFFHSLRAAYPGVRFQWRRVWGAYFAAVGFNNVVPARGGDVIKLFLTRSSIPGSSYPTVASAFFVESIFDATVGVLVLIFAFTQGVFPKPPNFSKLSSFDISYLASHFRLTLFLITALGVLGVAAFAVLAGRARAFWARVRQGVVILRDRRRYLREVAALQAVAWLCRAASFWFFLEAFRVGASVKNVLLVFAVNQVAGAVPFTPGGAGVQQAPLPDGGGASDSQEFRIEYLRGAHDRRALADGRTAESQETEPDGMRRHVGDEHVVENLGNPVARLTHNAHGLHFKVDHRAVGPFLPRRRRRQFQIRRGRELPRDVVRICPLRLYEHCSCSCQSMSIT